MGRIIVLVKSHNKTIMALVLIQFGWGAVGRGKGGGDGRLFEFEREGGGWGGDWCLFETGRLFEVGANSRLGAYSNKYGILKFRH